MQADGMAKAWQDRQAEEIRRLRNLAKYRISPCAWHMGVVCLNLNVYSRLWLRYVCYVG